MTWVHEDLSHNIPHDTITREEWVRREAMGEWSEEIVVAPMVEKYRGVRLA